MHAAARVIINHHPKTVYTKPLSLLLDYKIFQTGRATRVNFPLAHTQTGARCRQRTKFIFSMRRSANLLLVSIYTYKCAPTYWHVQYFATSVAEWVSGWNKFFVSRPGLDYSSAEGNKFARYTTDAFSLARWCNKKLFALVMGHAPTLNWQLVLQLMCVLCAHAQ